MPGTGVAQPGDIWKQVALIQYYACSGDDRISDRFRPADEPVRVLFHEYFHGGLRASRQTGGTGKKAGHKEEPAALTLA
jgi:hypothetical protein